MIAELGRRTLSARDVAVLIAAPAGWAAVVDRVVDAAMVGRPELAVSVLAMRLHPAGAAVRFDDQVDGPAHAPQFRARAHAGEDRGGWRAGLTVKAAAWSLLQHPRRQPKFGDPRIEQAPAVEKRDPGVAGRAVALVNDHAYRHRNQPPVWVFACSGPGHRPEFTCTGNYLGFTVTGVGSSKTAARAAAAAALLQLGAAG